jgi:hypothetical protein
MLEKYFLVWINHLFQWKKIENATFLEHIFKKMGSTEIVVSSVRPSVRPSPISQPL